MFLPKRLAKLSPAHRLRKASLLLFEVETAARGSDGAAAASAIEYARGLAAFLSADGDSPSSVREAAEAFRAAVDRQAGIVGQPLPLLPDAGAIRALNSLRHLLIREGGQAPADWDLMDPATGKPDPAARRSFPGMLAFLEDIRSPFNVGSMFRSAEAFGVEELLLSPGSADPAHPRATRSAMGAIELVPWRRSGLETLAQGNAFALELGGTPLAEFDFPERGIVVVGSEELGVSAAALKLCGREAGGLGTVSIPMAGAKGSLNVGVAFGILLAAWSASLSRKALSPLSV